MRIVVPHAVAMTPNVTPCARPRKVLAVLSIFAFVLSAIVTEPAAVAQTQTATLVGSVKDSSGAVIAGAKVTVVNPETSFRSETVTSSEGSYYVPYLSPGAYQLTLEAAGFKRYVHDSIMIRTGETPRVDVQMELGNVTEQVEVSATNALLATDTTIVGEIMDPAELSKLQPPQGEAIRFMNYFPTVEYSGPGGDYHIGGLRTRAIGYTLDGMNAKTPGTNTLNDTDGVLLPNSEALEELSVTTSGMSAEVGHSAGGAMSLVFKSGTNQLHASLDERYVWKQLVQRDFLTQIPLYQHPVVL
jgi:Carboxypeptidase regulatory-like domain